MTEWLNVTESSSYRSFRFFQPPRSSVLRKRPSPCCGAWPCSAPGFAQCLGSWWPECLVSNVQRMIWMGWCLWKWCWCWGWLSGWFQPLWKIWKSVGIIIPNVWKNKTCSKLTSWWWWWWWWWWCWGQPMQLLHPSNALQEHLRAKRLSSHRLLLGASSVRKLAGHSTMIVTMFRGHGKLQVVEIDDNDVRWCRFFRKGCHPYICWSWKGSIQAGRCPWAVFAKSSLSYTAPLLPLEPAFYMAAPFNMDRSKFDLSFQKLMESQHFSLTMHTNAYQALCPTKPAVQVTLKHFTPLPPKWDIYNNYI